MRTDDDEPNDLIDAQLDKAWELLTSGDYKAALEVAERTLEMESSSPDAHNLIGFIHAAGGDADKALEHYYHAIEADEFFVEPMLNAADLLIHPLANFPAALRMIDDALAYCETVEERTEALILKAEALMQLGEVESAARVVAEMPEGPFEAPHLSFMAGKARFEVGDMDRAEALLRDARTREPHNADASYFLGLVLEARGERELATVEFLTTRMLDAQAAGPPWSLSAEVFERRVRGAMQQMPEKLAAKLEGSLVVAADLPGLEIIAEGVDPRIPVLLDDVPPPGREENLDTKVGRLFVYQRNVERSSVGATQLIDDIRFAIERELVMIFPELAKEASPPSPPRGGGTGEDEGPQGGASTH